MIHALPNTARERSPTKPFVQADVPEKCRGCALERTDLCCTIRNDRCRGSRRTVTRHFARGQSIVEQGTCPGFLGVIRSGYAFRGLMRPDGKRILMDLGVPGEMIGGLPGLVSPCSLEAATDLELCTFDIATVQRLMQDSHHFRRLVLQQSDAQHQRLLEAVWRYGALDSRERIIAFLVMATEIMPSQEQPDGSVILTIDIPRRDWADMTNTAVETISRTVRGLADRGLVTPISRARLQIHDLQRLACLAGMESVAWRRNRHVRVQVDDDRSEADDGDDGRLDRAKGTRAVPMLLSRAGA